MPKPIPSVKYDAFMNVIDIPKVVSKAKPKLWDDTETREYWLRRDRVIYKTTMDEQTKQEILERYGKANT